MMPRRWFASLRVRLALFTVVGLALALMAAGFTLQSLFHDEVRGQFQQGLIQQLDEVTARLALDAQGRPQVNAEGLSDPRWRRPYSGLYWQVDELPASGASRQAVLRSRSLWDSSLTLLPDPLGDGALHVHQAPGPQGASLMVLERTVRIGEPGQATPSASSRWRLMVAADLRDTHAATARFQRVLMVSLLALLMLLGLVTMAQLSFGLKPLVSLQKGLQAVQQGQSATLEGRFPSELQPLVSDFNQVLDQHRQGLARARTQAGNLAHALKTPLAVMQQAAQRAAAGSELAALVIEQVDKARRQVDWHLKRARLAATHQLPGHQTDVATTVSGLVRVMNKVHVDKGLTLLWTPPDDASLQFAGDEQDLQEMVGNLLDNACKWADQRVAVRVEVSASGQMDAAGSALCIHIEDDGPGIPDAMRAEVTARGSRLDETVPGSGLGLDIVHELASLYGGRLQLQRSEWGGLAACLTLPMPPLLRNGPRHPSGQGLA
jgi:signal transduction histidine kinase